jgi:hypothetical protein
MDSFEIGRMVRSLEAANAKFNAGWGFPEKSQQRPSRMTELDYKEANQAMTKSLEIISEAVRNPKPPFRKLDNQPKKPLKHRYERRKIKEYLHLGDWVSGGAT